MIVRPLSPSLRSLAALLLVAACAHQATPASPSERVAAAAAAPSAPKAADPADKGTTAPMPVDPTIRLGQLDNGLHYFIRKHQQPVRRAALRLVIDVGSVLETDAQRGLAHYIEHMAFNGTRRFPKTEIVDYLERAGMRFGADANASTSFDETIYTFTVPTDDPALLARSFLMLEQMAHEISFDAEEVNKERGVILEERRLGLGAEMRVLEQIIPVLFKGSRYAERVPIGTLPVLEHATPADLRAFYDRWYRPDLMAVVAVGDFDVDTIEQTIRTTFAAIPKPTTPANRPVYVVPEEKETLVAIGQDAELPTTTVGVLHKLPRRSEASEGDYRRRIVENLYHSMLNARLEEQTRTQDPPFLFAGSASQDLVRPVELFAAVAGVKQDGVGRGLEALTREVERVDRYGFTAGELARAKVEQLRRMQSLAKERQNLPADAFADELVRHYLTGEAVPGIEAELRLHDRYLPTIMPPEMNAIAHDWLGDEDRVVLVEAPKTATVPTRDALLSLFHTTEQAPLPPYVDRAVEGPLVTGLPAPGKIEKTTALDDIGVTEWRLSNGVRVVVKPTDFKRDEVLLEGFAPGGTSLASDRDELSARFAASIVGSSGLGKMDPTQLRNALAGKLVEVTPFIQDLEEGVAGQASPQDLETLFQLIYLTFTAPRRDDGVFAAFRAQLADQLAHRDVDPHAVFAEKRQVVLFGNNPRRRPLQPGDEKKISLDRALDFYKARFSDAGDFTFVIVGSVHLDTVAALATKYLGALPAKGHHETWRDLHIHPVAGVHKFEVKKGHEPQSVVSMTFTGTQRWSEHEDQVLSALIETLSIRLREVLREGMSGTYNVHVSGDLQRRPDQRYQTGISFGCAPDNLDSLVAATYHELDEAKAGKLGTIYTEKVRPAEDRAFDQGLTTNSFWLEELAERLEFNMDPNAIPKGREIIDAVTPAEVQEAAGRYFARKNYVLGVLRPEPPAVTERQGRTPPRPTAAPSVTTPAP